MQLDHAFIVCQPGAPEGEWLEKSGWVQTQSRRHPGQGTENKLYRCGNFTLELIWLADEQEVTTQTAPTDLAERMLRPQNPFGLALVSEQAGEFDWLDYRPSYLPPGISIQVLSPQRLVDPMVFLMPGRGSDEVTSPQPWQRLTQMVLHQQDDFFAADWLASANIKVRQGEPLMELTFDKGHQGQSQDYRPHLPLLIHY